MLPCPRAEAHSLKAALECILAGAYWPNDRVKLIRPEVDDACPRCGQPDSALHQFWTCAHNERIEDPRVASTQDLIPLAVDEADIFPCLWLRGLLPSSRLVVPKSFSPVSQIRCTHTSESGTLIHNYTQEHILRMQAAD